MLPLRKQINDYSRSCEHLIAAAAETDAIPFSQDEIDWIVYYTTEMTSLVDQLVRKSKTQVQHDRQTIQEFAVASEALFLTKGLSEGERDSIRHSVSDVTTNILDEQER
ncbi:MAG: hypothetical protein NDI90_10855 [Nitrospira sp. BO4]|jgi:hypothetical protein|nr:hypothetical protein [Nitrospira sp. BO4]